MTTVQTANLPWNTPRSVDHIGKPRIFETVTATNSTSPSYFDSRSSENPVRIAVFPLVDEDTFTAHIQQSVDDGSTWDTVEVIANTDASPIRTYTYLVPGVKLRVYVHAASNASGVRCQLVQ